jgi:alpha-1,6-mannosyltransferase
MIKSGILRNKSILISVLIILIFLILPWVFTETARSNNDTQVREEVDLVKSAADLLSPQVWWYLLPLSVFLLILAFYLGTRGSHFKPKVDSDASPVNANKGLILRGFLSLEAYLFFFLLPFPLQRYYDLRRVSMGWIADRSWAAAITLSITMVALFMLYISAYRLSLRQDTRQMWMIVLGGAFLFALLNLFVFPISSTDLYDYVSRGRISGIYGGNPLVKVPDDYPFDTFVQLAAWKKDPSAYGPLWEVISGLIGRFVGAQLLLNMLGYKMIAFVSYILSVLFIALILRNHMPHRSLAGTLLFAWNPLILLDGIANGHNDMLMVALFLGAFWILSTASKNSDPQQKFGNHYNLVIYGILALLFLTLAILIKFIPILLLPPFLLYLLAQKKNWRQRLGLLSIYLVAMLLVIFVYYRVFWEWPEITDSIIHRTEMFRTSLASITNQILGQFLQSAWAQGIAAYFFLSIFELGYFVILFRIAVALGIMPTVVTKFQSSNIRWGKFLRAILLVESEDQVKEPLHILISASLQIFLLYLLLGSLWFWPWYVIWPLALLALSKELRFINLLVLVSCAGELSFILWNFVWYWMGIEWSTLHIVETLALGIIIIPAILLYLMDRQQIKLSKSFITKE